jgi:GT2 family glycosyltransferase
MDSSPLFSVIIPTYHRNELLSQCLDCLSPGVQTLTSDQYEVIVTDDGSRTTAERLVVGRYGWAKWVVGPGKGPAANRNNGAKYAVGDWLAFVDDDCLPDPQWLKSYGEAITANPDYLVFEGRVYADRPKLTLAEAAPIFETGGYLPSGNFVCRKDIFESLGGFDERFPYAAMEDVDLRTRLLKAGHRFLFIREASVCHPWREKGNWKSLKRSQKSTFIYLSLHPEERSRINSYRVLRMGLNILIRDTIPGILKFKGRGICKALLEHLSLIQGAFLLLRHHADGSNTHNDTKSKSLK